MKKKVSVTEVEYRELERLAIIINNQNEIRVRRQIALEEYKRILRLAAYKIQK